MNVNTTQIKRALGSETVIPSVFLNIEIELRFCNLILYSTAKRALLITSENREVLYLNRTIYICGNALAHRSENRFKWETTGRLEMRQFV